MCAIELAEIKQSNPRRHFLTVEEEERLSYPIQMYRQLIQAVLPEIPKVNGIKIPREERAEAYITHLRSDLSRAYPVPDFAYIVDRGRLAIGKMMAPNYGLIVDLAQDYKDYCTSGYDFDDLISAGNLALRRAALTFDYRRGYRFITYAAKCIRWGIRRDIDDYSSLIRFPVDISHDRSKVENAAKSLTPLRLKYIQAARLLQQVISLDKVSLSETVVESFQEEQYDRQELRIELLEAMSRFGLSKREKAILFLRYSSLKWPEIGKYFGIKQARTRQIAEEGFDKLKKGVMRDAVTSARLKVYLE